MKGQKRPRSRKATKETRSVRSKFATAGSGTVPRSIHVKSGNGGVVSISRQVTLTALQGATGVDALLGYSFQLSDLPNYTQFTQLYDQYRFIAVKMEFIPENCYGPTASGAGVITQVSSPWLTTCIDLDDATTPTSAIVQSHDTAKMHGVVNGNCVNKYVRWIEPQIAVSAYQSGGFTGYTPKTKQWIDSNSSGVQHYGLKAWLFAPSNSGTYRCNVVATYYLEFKLPF